MRPFNFFTRDSGGGLTLIGYHPRWSLTWIWSLSLQRWKNERSWRILQIDPHRSGQWHHWLSLPFGYALLLSRQDFHREQSK